MVKNSNAVVSNGSEMDQVQRQMLPPVSALRRKRGELLAHRDVFSAVCRSAHVGRRAPTATAFFMPATCGDAMKYVRCATDPAKETGGKPWGYAANRRQRYHRICQLLRSDGAIADELIRHKGTTLLSPRFPISSSNIDLRGSTRFSDGKLPHGRRSKRIDRISCIG
jgi:hypothetical protein